MDISKNYPGNLCLAKNKKCLSYCPRKFHQIQTWLNKKIKQKCIFKRNSRTDRFQKERDLKPKLKTSLLE